MGIFDKQEEQAPQPYTVAGKQLICQHCSNDTFIEKQMVIHYAGSFVNNSCTCFICSDCTHMHWFQASDNPRFTWESGTSQG